MCAGSGKHYFAARTPRFQFPGATVLIYGGTVLGDLQMNDKRKSSDNRAAKSDAATTTAKVGNSMMRLLDGQEVNFVGGAASGPSPRGVGH